MGPRSHSSDLNPGLCSSEPEAGMSQETWSWEEELQPLPRQSSCVLDPTPRRSDLNPELDHSPPCGILGQHLVWVTTNVLQA